MALERNERGAAGRTISRMTVLLPMPGRPRNCGENEMPGGVSRW